MITLEQAEEQLAFRQAFNAGNLNAFWAVLADGEMVYCVYSYQTKVAQVDGEGAWVDNTKYSQTTSKHQNIIRRAWEMN
jgi:major membrane immunogen (membrane-anchored lipoprotein)